jgi:ribose transport system substrate-binding protein
MRLTHVLVASAAVAALTFTSIAGAASGASTRSERPAAKKLTIGYINHIDAIPFIQLVRKSIQSVGGKQGASVLVCNPNGDAQKAVNCAAQFKAQKVDGIINFQPVEAAGPRVCAAGPKVPVISIDIHQRPCERVFYGADNAGAGRLAGTALGKYIKTKFDCEVDAFVSMEAPAVGVVNNQRMGGILAGYKSVCGAPPSVLKVDGKGATDPAIQPATDTLTRLSGKHKILVVSLNDDMAIGAIKAAQSSGRLGDIYVAAQGADPTSWGYICGNKPFKNWVADTAYFPELYGSRVVPAMISLIEGQKQPKVIFTNHRVVTPQNIKSIYPSACK